MVSGGYFSILGVHPFIGRQIGAEDDVAENAHPVAMISHAFWKRRFNLDPSVLGKTIALSGTPFTIIGVTPPEFVGLEVGVAPDIFVPVMMQPTLVLAQENLLADRPALYHTWLRVFGRLKPGVTAGQAAAALHPLFQQEIPEGRKFESLRREKVGLHSAATGLSDLREPFAEPLFILMGVVATVLLIACANIANLLLARAAARQPEFAMRLALGAGRRRLMGQVARRKHSSRAHRRCVRSGVRALVGAVSRQFHVGRTHTDSARPDTRRRRPHFYGGGLDRHRYPLRPCARDARSPGRSHTGIERSRSRIDGQPQPAAR